MQKIITDPKSIIVAADVSLSRLGTLAEAMQGLSGIGAFKTGFSFTDSGLGWAVSIIKSRLGDSFPVIHDHQKAGNDIPPMGLEFADMLKRAGVDAAILFPFAGPETQEVWTKVCFEAGLQVLTGGVMTHKRFLRSEGGYIADEAVEEIYELACNLGVRHFVVPGTKIDWVRRIHGLLVRNLGVRNFTLYAPGFISQLGDITECGAAAGDNWHAIVGSAIYKKETVSEMQEAARLVTKQILA